MQVKKAFGKVYGANFTAAEKKAMDLEIQREIAEFDRKNMVEIDALILWELMEQLGFGEKRLRQFFDSFEPALEALIKRYEMEESDQIWLCTRMLKERGIDVEKWNKERGN